MMDEIDVKILKILLKDVRTSFTDISKECGISTNAILIRYNKLKDYGIITGTSIICDLEYFGFKFPLSVDINVEVGKEDEIIEIIKKMPNLKSCYQVIGKYDIHAVFYIKSFDELDTINHEIKQNQSVKRVGLTATYDSLGFFPENLNLQPQDK